MRRFLFAASLLALASLPSCSTTDGCDAAPAPDEQSVNVVYLKHTDSNHLAATLREFLRDDPDVVVTSHGESNSLLIQASGQRWKQVAALIDKLDVKRP
ncbi:MAG: hypothetical protein KAI24_22285 [Planctomycetes bacterium]|nr:hypothetical protein [Planctomycetota bacterium]